MTRQVVHDDDVARGERRREDLLDVGEETCAVDRTIKDRRGREAGHAQRGQKRGRVPAPVRRMVRDARPVQPAAIPTDEVRPDATFIENTRRAGSRVGATACHAVRARATSARSCSGRADRFFKTGTRAA